MEEKMMQLKEKLENMPALAEKLAQEDSAEGAQAALQEAGLDFSRDEVVALRDTILKHLENVEGELSDDDLEHVAGGAVFTVTTVGVIGAIIGGAGIIGTGIAIGEFFRGASW